MIPFRTQRMATSVVNRILDVYEGHVKTTAPGEPAAPAALLQGAELDSKINQQQPPVDADPQTAQQIALAPLAK